MSDLSNSIWHSGSRLDLEHLNAGILGTACEQPGVQITEVGEDFLRGTMPADHRTFQLYGLVHGGSNVVLAETPGSLGANLVVDSDRFYCVGQEVNANHVRGVRGGTVTGAARLAYRGRSSQVWEIYLEDDRGRLTCISRLTMAVVKRRHG